MIDIEDFERLRARIRTLTRIVMKIEGHLSESDPEYCAESEDDIRSMIDSYDKHSKKRRGVIKDELPDKDEEPPKPEPEGK